MTTTGPALLSGYRVALLSAHHDAGVGMLLQRYGAVVSTATTTQRAEPTADDQLYRQTTTVVDAPPDVVITTTAAGIRRWIAVADRWGLRNDLVAALSRTRILACDPKAVTALHAVGLSARRFLVSAPLPELLQHLGGNGPETDGLRGRRIVVELPDCIADPDPTAQLPGELAARGADVTPVRVGNRFGSAPAGGLDRLITAIAARQFDAVGFSSATAAKVTLKRADDLGVAPRLLSVLRAEARVICADPDTAVPLVRRGIPAAMPRGMRHEDFARHIADELRRTDGCVVYAAGHRIELHGDQVLVDSQIRPVSLSGVVMLRLLASRPGDVVSREELMRAMPGTANTTHAVEAAVARLRSALGDKRIVATVIKRGYRLSQGDPAGVDKP